MFNEVLFFSQIIIVSAFALGSLAFGRSGLVSFISVSWLIANLFVPKEATLFGLSVLTSDVFAVGCDVGISLLREYYGEDDAKKAIYTGLYILLFFLVVSQILILYTPSLNDTSHIHFEALFGRMPRIIITGFFVSLLSKNLNLVFLNGLTKLIGDRYFQLKAMCAIAAAQLIDTVLFCYIALYGVATSVNQIIFFSYSVKLLAIIFCVPIITQLHKYIYKPRGI